uniref:Uncharacterized protein n=1 Tax=viral metagenome TaxID=1070528 RepID=A0A6M3LNG2_9ZZZZ
MEKRNNPGSDEAIEAGCSCAVLDNEHGAGCGWTGENGQPLFWITSNCPIHGGLKDGPET